VSEFDFFLHMGDVYIHVNRNSSGNDDAEQFLLPSLQRLESPGPTLGRWLKALCVNGGLQKYRDYLVKELHDNPSAGGIRHGVINFLCMFMPPDFVCFVTGHCLKAMSAMYEYLNRPIPMCIPGMTVLCGWRAFPWGQIGVGPQPASLSCLENVPGLNEKVLDALADDLFQIVDDDRIEYHVNGRLRPVVHAMLAAEIMYYESRKDNGQMLRTLEFIRTAWIKTVLAGDIRSGLEYHADRALCDCGELIRAAFDAANLHLVLQKTTSLRTISLASSSSFMRNIVGASLRDCTTKCAKTTTRCRF
jgi:hypothetical protein